VLHAPDVVQVLLGAIIFIPAGLLYVRSPALSASDREILKTVTPGKVSGLMQRVGFLPA
jgi:hypothetical protein